MTTYSSKSLPPHPGFNREKPLDASMMDSYFIFFFNDDSYRVIILINRRKQ